MFLSNENYTRRLQLLFFALLSASATLLFHAIGLEASLYWSQWWFDVVAHLLAGFSLGLFIPFFFSKQSKLPLFVIVLIVIGWELFEVFILGISVTTPLYPTDTLIDVFLGLCASLVAIRLFYR